MIRVSTADLKARLGHFLSLVRGGETIEVTSHRHAVARIVSVAADSEHTIISAERPISETKKLPGVRPRHDVDVTATLVADRLRR